MATREQLTAEWHATKAEYDRVHEAYKREKSCGDACPYALGVYYCDGMELAAEVESIQERLAAITGAPK